MGGTYIIIIMNVVLRCQTALLTVFMTALLEYILEFY